MPVPEWMPFSPVELRVLRVLLDRGALSREQIATALNESPDGRLRGILATLVARRVLCVTTDGYQVNAASERRAELLAWITTQEGTEGESQPPVQ